MSPENRLAPTSRPSHQQSRSPYKPTATATAAKAELHLHPRRTHGPASGPAAGLGGRCGHAAWRGGMGGADAAGDLGALAALRVGGAAEPAPRDDGGPVHAAQPSLRPAPGLKFLDGCQWRRPHLIHDARPCRCGTAPPDPLRIGDQPDGVGPADAAARPGHQRAAGRSLNCGRERRPSGQGDRAGRDRPRHHRHGQLCLDNHVVKANAKVIGTRLRTQDVGGREVSRPSAVRGR